MTTGNILENCLREGFIDYNTKADSRYVPRIVTNNRAQKTKVLDTLVTQLTYCDEFYFSVAFITKSGIACLKDVLLEYKDRPVKGYILASQYLNFTEPDALRDLLTLEAYLCPPSSIELRMVTEDHGFHAKGYLFHLPNRSQENYTMILGSSNLTASALTTNQEWNVFFTSSKDGGLIRQMRSEFDTLWKEAVPVDEDWIKAYEQVYTYNRPRHTHLVRMQTINPNAMQKEALQGLQQLRDQGADRGLLISATGTGKTYLSAFDVRIFRPRRFLFIVHRELIAKAARQSYENVWCAREDTGLLSGSQKDWDAPYLFCTIQTLSQPDVYTRFSPDSFDYIVVDEVHRAGAASYQRIFRYFKPRFWLGMTATPERSDDFDIYELFHHHIAYEIRLHQALAENMLVPFHYHGIADISVNGQLLDESATIQDLTCEERVRHILYYSSYYGCDGNRLRCLIFCSRIEEARILAGLLQKQGRRAVALSGDSTPEMRDDAIRRLEGNPDTTPDYIEYILTRDIFNEGVDIPSIDQIIMLRPTQSAIIFVQQLGRGLRKFPHKRYLEVLDFIGNYKNNFLLPIALYGDRTYNKDDVRRTMSQNFLPGSTSVHFQDVVKEKIYEAINTRKSLADAQELKQSYKDLQYRLGRRPLMMDFVKLGDKDPYLYVQKSQSYFAYAQSIDKTPTSLTEDHEAVLKLVSLELANGKRLEELQVLHYLLSHPALPIDDLRAYISHTCGYETSEKTIAGIENVLSLHFFTQTAQKKYRHIPLVLRRENQFVLTSRMKALTENSEFLTYLNDCLDYGMYQFHKQTDGQAYAGEFVRYGKYSRKDVSRLLNYKTNREGTLNGYAIVDDNDFETTGRRTCPIFVTYEKSDDISESTKYEDRFIAPDRFSWMTRSRVRLDSREVPKIQSPLTRKLLFVKKSDGEGTDFYYLGDLSVAAGPVQKEMTGNNGKTLPVVNFQFKLDVPVETRLYEYLTH